MDVDDRARVRECVRVCIIQSNIKIKYILSFTILYTITLFVTYESEECVAKQLKIKNLIYEAVNTNVVMYAVYKPYKCV